MTNRSPSTQSSGDPEVFNIAMHPALVPAFKDWLAARHLHLAGPIPTEDGEPFYFVGINDDHPGMDRG